MENTETSESQTEVLQSETESNEVVYNITSEVGKDEAKPERGSKLILTAMNLSNNIVGSGIITLPLAIKDSGVGVGIIMLIISDMLCGWSLVALSVAADATKTNTYEKMIKKLLGKAAYIILCICTFIFPITGAMAYSIAIGDNLSLFFQGFTPSISQLQIRAVVLCVPFFVIIFPLSSLRTLKFLDKFSSISMGLVAFYIAVILYKTSIIPNQTVIAPTIWSFGKNNAVKALPVFAFACSAHHNTISLYKSLHKQNIMRFIHVKNIAITLATVAYVIVSLCGYITFGGHPFGNIFNNYCADDYLVNVTRMIFAITLMLTAPMQIFGPREMLVMEAFGKFKRHHIWLRPVIAFIITAFCFIIGSTVTNLTIVVELGSAISNVPIVYIIPAICMIKLYGRPYYPNNYKKILAYFVLVFGIFMIIAGPVFSIIDVIKIENIPAIPKYFCDISLKANL